jgi:hypothetical protein
MSAKVTECSPTTWRRFSCISASGTRAGRVGDADDEIYTTLAELSGAIESADAQRSFLVRAHLGNYALWMSGVFPDYIELRRWRKGGPNLDYYEEMGRRGFTLAADRRPPPNTDRPPCSRRRHRASRFCVRRSTTSATRFSSAAPLAGEADAAGANGRKWMLS